MYLPPVLHIVAGSLPFVITLTLCNMNIFNNKNVVTYVTSNGNGCILFKTKKSPQVKPIKKLLFESVAHAAKNVDLVLSAAVYKLLIKIYL